MSPTPSHADSRAYDPVVAAASLRALAETPIAPREKGFIGLPAAMSPRELVENGATLHDGLFSTPTFVLRASAVRHNIAVLADYTARRGVLLAPHAKTTMSPELFLAQLDGGAWALTAASVTQAQVFADHGARRILIANEITDPVAVGALRRLLASTPELEVLCYVDGADSVIALSSVSSSRLRVLVEVGTDRGRTGARTVAGAIDLARLAGAAGLRVAGVSCFEGSVVADTDEAIVAGVTELCRRVRVTGARLSEAGLLDGEQLTLSAGGSHHFDIVIDELTREQLPGTVVVIRSGSYVTHDHGTYLRDSPAIRRGGLDAFQPAIEIRATVLSRPEPDLALIDTGRRDVSFDAGLPVVVAAFRGSEARDVGTAAIVDLNDQHGYVRLGDESRLDVGDTVVLGISHPCTTFDKWRLGLLIDDRDVVTGVIHTFF